MSCGWGTSRIKSSNCGLCLEGSRLLCPLLKKISNSICRQYLLFLDSHPEEYLKYLAWKGHYEVGLNQPVSSLFVSSGGMQTDLDLQHVWKASRDQRREAGKTSDHQRFLKGFPPYITHVDGVGEIILSTMEARIMSQIKTMTHYFKLRCGTRRTATPVGIIHKYLWSEH